MTVHVSGALGAKALGRKSIALPAALGVPTAMASAPTVTNSGASPTLVRKIGAGSTDASRTLPSAFSGGMFTYSRTKPGTTSTFLESDNVNATGSTTTLNGKSQLQVSFMHDGSNIELGIYAATTYGILIRVDGQYVSLTPTTYASQAWVKLAFGSRKVRRIDIIGGNWQFLGVAVDATDGIYPAAIRGPRVLCLMDSFSQLSTEGWPTWFADALGWDDVWSMGVGSTGFVANNSGNSMKLRDRIAACVIPYAPDIVMLLGSINDWSQSAVTVQSEATLSVQQIKASLPNCLVVGGMNANGGIEKLSSGALDVMDATKAGIQAGGGIWLNPIEQPIAWTGTPATQTLFAAHSAGRLGANPNTSPFSAANSATGIYTNGAVGSNNLPYYSTLEIDTGAVRERVVTNGMSPVSGSAVSYAFQGALQYAHASGAAVSVVGPSYLTGTGKVGTTTGWGNADVYVSSDGTHPSSDGHRALGFVQATMLRDYLTTDASASIRAGMVGVAA